MKVFEDLTKAEKEKLGIYLQYLNFLNISSVLVLLFGLTFFLAGYALIMMFVSYFTVLAGMFLVAVGILLVFLVVTTNLIDKKHLFLIFGYKNTYSDIFDIKKEDIRKVKIIREVKWIKEK